MDFFGLHHPRPACQWVTCHGGNVPPNAVPGGKDSDQTIFVGRAVHGSDIVPGKVVPSHGCCYVSYAGAEHSHKSYEVLVSDGTPMAWLPASNGSLPSGAIQGGNTGSREALFIGRTFHSGTLTVGKVHPSHRCLYIPYGGKEHRYTDYEALVCKTINF
ncbi:hypothetical protein HPB50_022609 [Hyalomma asiaticum]|uniref:Uncharacterized protein n=1 Tax=Hyalomma asiaticum TaxID=266040 RepID=A0ACB7TM98_HYAAI|nr:hypothetical protein HPB50_022609 [Hyalomma asiaticum]